jgi:hypothetical protein
MLNTLGHDQLRERSVGDDSSTEFLRIDGDPRSTTIVCLPWCMPYRLAMGRRIVPDDYLACYEMPGGIVSSEPEICIRALRAVVDDATRVFERSRLDASQVLVVGLSIGNAAATMFANRIGARLCSIASADRGDLTLWESPASRHIKARAEAKGYRLSDFTRALRGHHTIDRLANLGPGSRFVVGMKDELLPQARRDGLIEAVRRTLPAAEVIYVDAGHFGTMREAISRGLCEPAEVHLARARA